MDKIKFKIEVDLNRREVFIYGDKFSISNAANISIGSPEILATFKNEESWMSDKILCRLSMIAANLINNLNLYQTGSITHYHYWCGEGEVGYVFKFL